VLTLATNRQKNIIKKLGANGYKLRMRFNRWYLDLYKDTVDLGVAFGPYGYHISLSEATSLNNIGLIDLDRFAETGVRR
jgi:hypothetical protein